MIRYTEERETVIWFAGLISTDGIARNSSHSKGLAFAIYSAEEDWLKVIKSKLNIIEISSRIIKRERKKGDAFGKTMFTLWLNNPRKIALLFNKYNVVEFFNPRKWKIVKGGIKNYKRMNSYSKYTPQEDSIIQNNLHLSNRELANLFKKRTINSIVSRKSRLGLHRREKKQ